MNIQAFFDHRVVDGMDVIRLLADLEAVLNSRVVAELEQLALAGDRRPSDPPGPAEGCSGGTPPAIANGILCAVLAMVPQSTTMI